VTTPSRSLLTQARGHGEVRVALRARSLWLLFSRLITATLRAVPPGRTGVLDHIRVRGAGICAQAETGSRDVTSRRALAALLFPVEAFGGLLAARPASSIDCLAPPRSAPRRVPVVRITARGHRRCQKMRTPWIRPYSSACRPGCGWGRSLSSTSRPVTIASRSLQLGPCAAAAAASDGRLRCRSGRAGPPPPGAAALSTRFCRASASAKTGPDHTPERQSNL